MLDEEQTRIPNLFSAAFTSCRSETKWSGLQNLHPMELSAKRMKLLHMQQVLKVEGDWNEAGRHVKWAFQTVFDLWSPVCFVLFADVDTNGH